MSVVPDRSWSLGRQTHVLYRHRGGTLEDSTLSGDARHPPRGGTEACASHLPRPSASYVLSRFPGVPASVAPLVAPLVALLVALLVATSVAACVADPEALPAMTFELPASEVWKRPAGIPAPALGAGRVFITNNLEDTVSVIDLDALLAGAPAVLGKVPVGFVPVEREGPHHVTVDAEGEHYYLGISNFVPGGGSGPHGVHGNGSASGHLLKMRVADNSQVGSVRVDRNPGDVRLTPDGRLLVATHFDMLRVTEAAARGINDGPQLDSALAIVDPDRMRLLALVPACPAAHGISVTPDSAFAAMSCRSDEVAVVDLRGVAEGAVPDVTRFPMVPSPGTALAPACEPYAMTPDGRTAWTSCYASGALVAVDVEGAALDGRSLQLPGRAVFGDVHDGVMAVAHQQVDGVTFLNTADATVRSSRLISPAECVAPHATRFVDDGARLLVVCEGTKAAPGHLLLLDAAPPHALLAREELGLFPDDIAVMWRTP